MPSSYMLYLLGFVIVMMAQMSVQGAYQKYKKIANRKGYTGAQVARNILDKNGLSHVQVEVANGGVLSDHYDPTHHVVRLSADIYYNKSIASISVAAHEVGHAIQHKENYGLIALRNRLLPAASIASNLGWIVLFIGLFLFGGADNIVFQIGFLMLVVIVIFQLVTLPIELNASSRALKQLSANGYIYEDEAPECRAMLKAAAFTYLAALINSILQILRVLLIARRRND